MGLTGMYGILHLFVNQYTLRPQAFLLKIPYTPDLDPYNEFISYVTVKDKINVIFSYLGLTLTTLLPGEYKRYKCTLSNQYF
jgi:hypothetical protein